MRRLQSSLKLAQASGLIGLSSSSICTRCLIRRASTARPFYSPISRLTHLPRPSSRQYSFSVRHGSSQSTKLPNSKPEGEVDQQPAQQELPKPVQSAIQYLERAREPLSAVAQRIDELTGTDYSRVSSLEEQYNREKTRVEALRASALAAKHACSSAEASRHALQKELVSLLERRRSWTQEEAHRSGELFSLESSTDDSVAAARLALKNAESAYDEAAAQLEQILAARYHEEKLWSDRVKKSSKWVALGLAGLNILVWMGTEPRRRRRMMRVEERTGKTEVMVGEVKEVVEGMAAQLEGVLAERVAVVDSVSLGGEGHPVVDGDAVVRVQEDRQLQPAVSDMMVDVLKEWKGGILGATLGAVATTLIFLGRA